MQPTAGTPSRRVAGWLAPGTAAWWVASLGLVPAGAATSRAAALVLVAAGSAAAWRQRARLATFVRDRRRTIVAIEAVALVTFGSFLAVRAWNPAIFWGEKPMDFAILNALLRSAALPPADPWFAGDRLNYFYFGHAVTAVFSQVAGVGPAFAFNLALPTIAAMLACAAFAVALHACGRIAAGAWTAALVVFVGNVAGARVFLGGGRPHLDFDYFWATSRVVPGTINEYPFWNLVFADLHAHVLAMPLEVAAIGAGRVLDLEGPLRPMAAGRLAGPPVGVGGRGRRGDEFLEPAGGGAALQFGLLATAWLQGSRTFRGLARGLASVGGGPRGCLTCSSVRSGRSTRRRRASSGGSRRMPRRSATCSPCSDSSSPWRCPPLVASLVAWVRERPRRVVIPALLLGTSATLAHVRSDGVRPVCRRGRPRHARRGWSIAAARCDSARCWWPPRPASSCSPSRWSSGTG